jgi:hypothetical protein
VILFSRIGATRHEAVASKSQNPLDKKVLESWSAPQLRNMHFKGSIYGGRTSSHVVLL